MLAQAPEAAALSSEPVAHSSKSLHRNLSPDKPTGVAIDENRLRPMTQKPLAKPLAGLSPRIQHVPLSVPEIDDHGGKPYSLLDRKKRYYLNYSNFCAWHYLLIQKFSDGKRAKLGISRSRSESLSPPKSRDPFDRAKTSSALFIDDGNVGDEIPQRYYETSEHGSPLHYSKSKFPKSATSVTVGESASKPENRSPDNPALVTSSISDRESISPIPSPSAQRQDPSNGSPSSRNSLFGRIIRSFNHFCAFTSKIITIFSAFGSGKNLDPK